MIVRGPDFLCLANALSALYPQGCTEKRLLDAMLLAVARVKTCLPSAQAGGKPCHGQDQT